MYINTDVSTISKVGLDGPMAEKNGAHVTKCALENIDLGSSEP